jgi:YVTN family beta-propeller protein
MRLLIPLFLATVTAYAQAQATQHLFVVNKNGDTLSIVNSRTLSVERSINVGSGPHEVAIAPDGKSARQLIIPGAP